MDRVGELRPIGAVHHVGAPDVALRSQEVEADEAWGRGGVGGVERRSACGERRGLAWRRNLHTIQGRSTSIATSAFSTTITAAATIAAATAAATTLSTAAIVATASIAAAGAKEGGDESGSRTSTVSLPALKMALRRPRPTGPSLESPSE